MRSVQCSRYAPGTKHNNCKVDFGSAFWRKFRLPLILIDVTTYMHLTLLTFFFWHSLLLHLWQERNGSYYILAITQPTHAMSFASPWNVWTLNEQPENTKSPFLRHATQAVVVSRQISLLCLLLRRGENGRVVRNVHGLCISSGTTDHSFCQRRRPCKSTGSRAIYS